METITTPQDADQTMASPLMLIFKHSTRCPVSRTARAEVENFLNAHPGTPACLVDVIAHRSVSLHIAEKTGVRHESPQAILMADGRTVWHASHWSITRAALESAMLPLMKPE